MNRRDFIKSNVLGGLFLTVGSMRAEASPRRPNVILCMTDDQGWGDTGYNGHPHLLTPNLDKMVAEGIRFNRFYSAAPVCSPTRGSAITGRDPYRYGIDYANRGSMRSEEITLGTALKTKGYATGHFGKWHLGTLTTDVLDSNRGAPGRENIYAPPWDHGFDVCFSTEAKVPTYNPMEDPDNPGEPYLGDFGRAKTRFWKGPGEYATENLDGCASRVVMDRVIPFIEGAVENEQPFLALVWLHTPHVPFIGPPEEMKLYEHISDHRAQNYYATLTAMDKEVGRLRAKLEELGVADNTMLWFASDNGPDFLGGGIGSTGGLRGRKHRIYEGGIRVPGILVWPDMVPEARVTEFPASTNDYYPTVLDAVGFEMPHQPTPVDGMSLMPLIRGEIDSRPVPMAFKSTKHGQIALVDNRYKVIRPGPDEEFELYDLVDDPAEETDLGFLHQALTYNMADILREWEESCEASARGEDYVRD